jgi:MFS family permease
VSGTSLRDTDVPLRRNRDFTLLWTSQSLSALGGAVAQLAVPLLVLTLTGSAVRAGAVGTAAQVAGLAARLPAGVLADRLNRRTMMLICDAIRLVAFAALAVAVAAGRVTLAGIVAVALVDALCGTLVDTTEHAALRSVVPPAQLPAAVARNEARAYGTSLAGPPLGGLLFGLAGALPFAGNALSYLASLAGIAMLRKPLQTAGPAPAGQLGALREGLAFVFGNPFLRAVLIIAAPLNFALTGTAFAIIVTLQRHGVPPAMIGLTETIVAAGGLAGAVLAPVVQRWLPFALLIRSVCWAATVLLAVSALLSPAVGAAVPVAAAVLLTPSCNAALFGYQAAITPDRLQGRVLSVIFLVAMSAAAMAPLLAGVFVMTFGGHGAVLLFALAGGTAAVTAMRAPGLPAIRTGPTRTGPTTTGPTSTGPTSTGPTNTEPANTEPTSTGPVDADRAHVPGGRPTLESEGGAQGPGRTRGLH